MPRTPPKTRVIGTFRLIDRGSTLLRIVGLLALIYPSSRALKWTLTLGDQSGGLWLVALAAYGTVYGLVAWRALRRVKTTVIASVSPKGLALAPLDGRAAFDWTWDELDLSWGRLEHGDVLHLSVRTAGWYMLEDAEATLPELVGWARANGARIAGPGA